MCEHKDVIERTNWNVRLYWLCTVTFDTP